MPAHAIALYLDPLDLLHRFTPTPLRVAIPLEFASVTLETNDLSFFPTTATVPNVDPQLPSCLWKLVRDFDSHQEPAEISIVMAGSVTVYSLGPACMIAADRDLREILGFIGAAIDERVFRDTIYPALLRLTEFVTRPVSAAPVAAAPKLADGDVCNA